MTPIPAFFYRRAVPERCDLVAEGDGFLVTRRGEFVVFHCFGRWRPGFEEVYRRHGADGVCVDAITVRGEPSLGFLRRLPSLRHLDLLAVDVPVDVATVAELVELESLRLNWLATESPGAIDFSRLGRLQECVLPWHPAFASVLECESLRILVLCDARGLKELNLTGLPQLEELGLISCSALTSIRLSEQSTLLALEVTNCGRLRLDWPRVGRDLRYLRLAGRIGFPVEEVAEAKALLYLWTELPSRCSPDLLDVLRDLPGLEGVRLIDLKIGKDAAKQIREINAARGNGRTLAARPPVTSQ